MTTDERRNAKPPAPVSHTPGPWCIEPDEASDCRGLVVVSPKNRIVCLLDSDETEEGHATDAEVWADARLIAAAPELLAALEAVLDNPALLDNFSDRTKFRTVIAKAKGEA